jgi:hypothetical protein
MSFVEMLPSVRALSRVEKLHLIQLLAEDLAQSEESGPLVPGQTYSLWSPHQAYQAAEVLLRELDAERIAS